MNADDADDADTLPGEPIVARFGILPHANSSCSSRASAVSVSVNAQSPAPAGSPPPWAYTVNPPPTPGATPAPVDPAPKQVPGTTVTLHGGANARCLQSTRLASRRASADARSGRAWPAAGDARVRVLSSRQRPGPSRERVARGPARGLHRPADGRLQERRSQERRAEDGPAQRDDPGREGGDRRRDQGGGGVLQLVPLQEMDSRRRSAATCRKRASPDRCTCRPATARSRSASASSRCPKIWRARNCETRRPDSSPTFRRAASRKASRCVKTGGGRTIACGTCHGGDLKGLGPVPPLAGRSPSYTIRQLFDLQTGVRKGPWSALMKSAVEKLTIDDMIAIAAYTSSREP